MITFGGDYMSHIERLVYKIFCVLSLGTIWLQKIIIKKAIIEAMRVK